MYPFRLRSKERASNTEDGNLYCCNKKQCSTKTAKCNTAENYESKNESQWNKRIHYTTKFRHEL